MRIRGQEFLPLGDSLTFGEQNQKSNFEMGEIVIHQVIETIEFVLGIDTFFCSAAL